jgi:hypothetical protein
MIEVGTFIVIGGGTVGAGYTRQLLRARQAGRLRVSRIVVVDHDAACAAASFGPPVELATAEWSPWLDDHLDGFGPGDQLVPYHWAPHLLRTWLTSQLTRRGATVTAAGGLGARGLPFETTTGAGDRALSYATWLCPPTCIEPGLCPHTRGPKDWSLAADLELPAPAETFDAYIVFRCLHLLYGVGTIPVRDIHAARDRLVSGLAHGRKRYVVSTSSHCHALAAGIEVVPAAALYTRRES